MKRHGYSTRLRTHPKAPYLHAARHPPLALHLGYGVLFLTAVIALPTMLRTGRVEQMAAAAGVGVANAASDAPTSTLAPTLASAPVPAPRLAAAGRASHNVCHWHERPHPSNRVPTEDGALAEASLLEPERPRAIRPPLARSRGAALRPSLAAWRSFALGLCVGALAAAVVLWHSLARRRAHLDRAERELCLREARTVRLELELDDRAHDAIVSCGQWEEYARQCAHERESALEQLELVRVHAQALQDGVDGYSPFKENDADSARPSRSSSGSDLLEALAASHHGLFGGAGGESSPPRASSARLSAVAAEATPAPSSAAACLSSGARSWSCPPTACGAAGSGSAVEAGVACEVLRTELAESEGVERELRAQLGALRQQGEELVLDNERMRSQLDGAHGERQVLELAAHRLAHVLKPVDGNGSPIIGSAPRSPCSFEGARAGIEAAALGTSEEGASPHGSRMVAVATPSRASPASAASMRHGASPRMPLSLAQPTPFCVAPTLRASRRRAPNSASSSDQQ